MSKTDVNDKKNQKTNVYQKQTISWKLFDNKKYRITCQKVKIEAEKTHDSWIRQKMTLKLTK